MCSKLPKSRFGIPDKLDASNELPEDPKDEVPKPELPNLELAKGPLSKFGKEPCEENDEADVNEESDGNRDDPTVWIEERDEWNAALGAENADAAARLAPRDENCE